MTLIFVQARQSDGEIVSHATSAPTELIDGCDLLVHEVGEDCHCMLDGSLHKVDWLSGEIVDKSAAERALASFPKPREISSAIYRELVDTDSYVVPDRPIGDAMRSAWTRYRQALRDLSKLAGPRAMIEAWPLRPNGSDAIAALRDRI